MYLNGTVDYETEETYRIDVQLISLQGFLNKDYTKTQITLNVVDVNDNKPYFIFPGGSKKFYAAIARNAPIATSVIQIKVPPLNVTTTGTRLT